MQWPGVLDAVTLHDGTTIEYWDGGDRSGPVVVFHPGTPNGRRMGVHLHAEALDAGLRLVSVSRPGYGGSTPAPPGLRRDVRLTVQLLDALGVAEAMVLGVSGGGPGALATAAVGGARIRAVAVAAGVAQWPVVDDPTPDDADERRWVAAAEAGDLAAATNGYLDQARLFLGPLLALDDEEMVATMFGSLPGGGSRRDADPDFRSVWAADLREALRTYDGYVRDNLSWSVPWDVDLGAVTARTFLWYGAEDAMVPPTHGQWLADRLPHADLEVRAGAGHGAVVFDHVPEMLQSLTRPG